MINYSRKLEAKNNVLLWMWEWRMGTWMKRMSKLYKNCSSLIPGMGQMLWDHEEQGSGQREIFGRDKGSCIFGTTCFHKGSLLPLQVTQSHVPQTLWWSSYIIHPLPGERSYGTILPQEVKHKHRSVGPDMGNTDGKQRLSDQGDTQGTRLEWHQHG